MVLRLGVSITLNKDAIAEHIPHAGQMVLLDKCISYSKNGLSCLSLSHIDTSNPLRTENGLSATCGIEYAAQAIALHSALLNGGNTGLGFLAICKNITFKLRYLDTITTEIQISVKYISGSAELGLLQYGFVISASEGKQELLSGELGIAIIKENV